MIGTGHARNAGYYINNQNDRRTLKEDDVQSCAHCQKLVLLRRDKDSIAVCMGCRKLVCGPCATRSLTYGCEPFLKKFETYAADMERLDKFLKNAGPGTPVPSQIITTG